MGDPNDSSGLRVKHDLEDLQRGQEYIMTLKDTAVVDGNSVNSNQAEVQNQLLQENNLARKKIYRSQKGATLLAKYDEQKESDLVPEGVSLDENGGYEAKKESKLEAIKHKLQFLGKKTESLETQQRITSDYIENESSLGGGGFKKRKTNLKKRKAPEIVSVPLKSAGKKKMLSVVEEEDELESAILLTSHQRKPNLEIEAVKKLKEETKEEMQNGTEATFDETESFLNSVETLNDKEKHSNLVSEKPTSLRQSTDGTMSVVNMALFSEKLAYAVDQAEEQAKNINILQKEVTDKDLEQIQAIYEPVIGKGLAGAVDYLRFRGMIGKNAQRYLGRNNDENPEDYMDKFAHKNERIKLDYHNEKGEQLTMKQAFRYMCWKFHGIKPSKRQQEKILRKEQHSHRIAKSSFKDTLLQKALKKEQKKQKVPFLVLDSKTNQPKKK